MSEVISHSQEEGVADVVKRLNEILSSSGYVPEETPVLVELYAVSPENPNGGTMRVAFHSLLVKTEQLPELVRGIEKVEKTLGKINQTEQGRTA